MNTLTTHAQAHTGQRAESNVWRDVHAYFTELFTEKPALQSVKFTEQQLVSDMEARFRGKYNPEMIAKLLKNGFEVQPGVYLFRRDDFIIEFKQREEVAS